VTRTIPASLAPVLEQLELEQADLVTMSRLDELVRSAGWYRSDAGCCGSAA